MSEGQKNEGFIHPIFDISFTLIEVKIDIVIAEIVIHHIILEASLTIRTSTIDTVLH
jgi:hypothetical protein